MFLVVDIGNTHSVVGLYEGDRFITHWRMKSDPYKTEDEYVVLLKAMLKSKGVKLRQVTDIALSSTVPTLVSTWQKLFKKYAQLQPLVISVDIETNLPILLDNPREIGPDRIVNSVGGRAKYGNNIIVVDMGTATTFDCISKNGEFMGGVIAPGIGVSADALFTRTAKLPKVEFVKPSKALATNTIEALQAGIIYGFAGQIDGIVKHLKMEMDGDVQVIATGGLASVIANVSETIDTVDQMLTLEGLRILYELNK